MLSEQTRRVEFSMASLVRNTDTLRDLTTHAHTNTHKAKMHTHAHTQQTSKHIHAHAQIHTSTNAYIHENRHAYRTGSSTWIGQLLEQCVFNCKLGDKTVTTPETKHTNTQDSIQYC
ncbi:hypothetical protein AGOR_G00183000 [Albula goreensis]|uniref:Uncharacterized protein n=1 Tax=Albula goreensis TaxID=1534307 RepID=A0A8T3CW10_9TELE|nr:hypothetical protein AGOR_G00183000 [Albula goreensis]